MALEKERETFEKVLPTLQEHSGRYVVIHGEDMLDIFDTYQDALNAAYQSYGVESQFLVKKIAFPERVHYITRDVDTPCRQ